MEFPKVLRSSLASRCESFENAASMAGAKTWAGMRWEKAAPVLQEGGMSCDELS